jgi:RNA polymerase sigma-70 factor (ECF subfamily)
MELVFPFVPHKLFIGTLTDMGGIPLSFAGSGSAEPPFQFEEVVEAHWTAVYRLLYSMTGNAHDTEDLAQETFLRALKRFETFKKGTNLRAWLLRIGTNAFFDVKRKKQTLKIGSLSEDVKSDERSAERSLELAEEARLVRLAVQELTELTRLVFHLRVTEELPFKEVAEIAGITEVAARQHMHQARAKLLKRLGESSA